MIQWSPSADPDVTSYEVSASINGGTPATTDNGKRTMKVDHYDAGDTHREYAVRAVTRGVPGDWTRTIRASLTQPGHPANPMANLEGPNGVRLHWEITRTPGSPMGTSSRGRSRAGGATRPGAPKTSTGSPATTYSPDWSPTPPTTSGSGPGATPGRPALRTTQPRSPSRSRSGRRSGKPARPPSGR